MNMYNKKKKKCTHVHLDARTEIDIYVHAAFDQWTIARRLEKPFFRFHQIWMTWIASNNGRVGVDGLISTLIFFRLVMATLTRLLIAQAETEHDEYQQKAHDSKNDAEIPRVDILLLNRSR